MKTYTEEQVLKEKNLSFNEGMTHTNSSPNTLKLIEKFENKFNEYTETHQKQHDELKTMLMPVVNTYEGVAFMSETLGKVLVIISIISGLIWGWFAFGKDLFK